LAGILFKLVRTIIELEKMSTIKWEPKLSGSGLLKVSHLVPADPKCASFGDKIALFLGGGDAWQHPEHVHADILNSLPWPGFNPYIECQVREGNRGIKYICPD